MQKRPCDEAAASGETYRAGPASPGARLLAAASLVRPGVAVADIGCDHGKLAVHLALRGGATKVVAVDNRPLPLARAKALVQRTGCAGVVDCRLGDGLAPLAPGEAADIVIAGMSGETMIGILQRAVWVRDGGVQLVLLPATRLPQLRRWLCEQGFTIQHETPVEERGRFYVALAATYTGEPFEAAPIFCEAGLLCGRKDPAAQGALAARLAHLHKRARADLTPKERQTLQRLTEELEACLK